MSSSNRTPEPSSLEAKIRLYNQLAGEHVGARVGLRDVGTQALDPVVITNLIQPLQTEGAFGGVNKSMLDAHASGLLVLIQPYPNMQEGDWIKVFWGDDGTPVASDVIPPNHGSNRFPIFVPSRLVPEGLHDLWCSVTRAGGGNGGESEPIGILTRTELPGGLDPAPDTPVHEGLLPPEADLPDGGIIDEDAAKEGIAVTIPGYPNMREYDLITFSWGGVLMEHEVTAAEAGAGEVSLRVTEAVIREAGDANELVLVYMVMDEVHNKSSGWSMRATVDVELGDGLFESPVILNPDHAADPYDEIDLDDLGNDDLFIEVYAERGGDLQVGDMVKVKWTGTTAQGETITVEPDEEEVLRIPMGLEFPIPNAEVIKMAQGRCVASYTVTRGGNPAGASKRSFASFLGVEYQLPKPIVEDAVDGMLDPTLDDTTLTISGEVLGAGDYVWATWLGTRSNGSALLEVFERGVSGGTAGKPMNFTVDGPSLIAPLNGGTVSVSYRLKKYGGPELESRPELLQVGEAQFELPAPSTRPPVDSGALDPETLPGQLEIVVSAYPGMKEGQTVHLVWKPSSGDGHTDWMPISGPMEGQEVVFYMDIALIEEYLGQTIELSYWVESPGESDRLSGITTFTVGARQDELPLPVVVEAKDDILNPGDAIRGATVRIPIEAGLVANDDVEVTWQGDKPGGVDTVNRLVLPEHVGKPFDLTVEYQYVEANTDGTVVVSYQVFRQNGDKPKSGAVTISVQRSALPLPVITQAEDDQLNPDDVLEGATVRINAAAQFKDGDVVTVVVAGRLPGGSTSIPYSVPPGGGGQAVVVTIPYAVINANNGSDFDLAYEIQRAAGGPVEPSESVTYHVNREVGTGRLRIMGARYNVNTYRASSAPRMISAFHDATLQPMLAEWRYEDSDHWTPRTHWFDNKPWLKLYVRNETETIELRPCNVIGNGIDTTANGSAAFVVMRDEVLNNSQLEVDLRAWGNEGYGGKITPTHITFKNIAEVTASSNGYVARLRDGYVIRWGGAAEVPENGTYEQIRSNAQAFCGIQKDRSLISWGPATHGVPVTPAVDAHKDYVEVVGAATAFAARRETGHVVAWGDPAMGGKMKEGQEVMGDIVQIAGNYGAFAALRNGGGSKSVIAWGHDSYGGDASKVAGLTNVKALGAATAQAFSILLDDGGVQAWGPDSHGGNVPTDILAMKDIVEVTSTWHAMCARRANGHVVAWGNPTNGGDVKEIGAVSDIVSVVGSAWSFAALRRDGSVVAWGAPATGGDTSGVIAQLTQVCAIYANSHGFTALTRDGRVVTWGVPAGGGDSSAAQPDIAGKLTYSRVVPAEEAAQLDPTAASDQGKA